MTSERWVMENYREWADKTKPVLHAVLTGIRSVQPQSPFAEAWIGYSLFCYDRLLSLEEVIESADSINHGIPKPDEIAWAFLSLRKRGWLDVQEDTYGLTSEGRRAISLIVLQGSTERLKVWISAHPSSGRLTARDVFLSFGKK